MPLTLTVLRCPNSVAPETRSIAGGEFTVGRGPGVDWVLPDPERLLSKHHFAVAYRSGAWQVADTSTNGTTLNTDPEPIGRGQLRTLRDGDRLKLGAYELEVRLNEEMAQPAAGLGANQPRGGSPFADPFGGDPFAPPAPPPNPFGEPAYPAMSQAGSAQLPADFDPLAPDLGEEPFQVTQPDHSSLMDDAFRPPSVSNQLPLHAGGKLPGDDLLPDDWDKDLLEGIAPPGSPASPGAPPAPSTHVPPGAPPVPSTHLPPGAPPRSASQAASHHAPQAYAAPPPVLPQTPQAYHAGVAGQQPSPGPLPPDVDPFAEPFDLTPPLRGPAAEPVPPLVVEPAPPFEPPPLAVEPAPPFEPPPLQIEPAPPFEAPPQVKPAPPFAPLPQFPQAPPPVQAAPGAAAPAVDDNGLLAAFLEGAGLPDARPGDPAATMQALGQAFRALVSGLRAVLIARASVKSEFRIEQTMIQARGNNPLKFSAGDDDALSALLGVGRRTDMSAEAAVADALKDIRLHELATMAAMQAAVRSLLQGLDPAALRAQAEQGGGLSLLPAQRKARAWDTYEALYTRTSQALSDDFDSVFGKAFARAYERAMDEVSAKERR